tara:strand:+ start:2458 stop:2814 length:357 start_codon:yes stop_codon:yes gene_type:complete
MIMTLNFGCSLKMPSLPKLGIPKVHKITVQQGNVITQEMVDQLKPGMSKTQVAYIMGEPIFRNTFDDSRWDYIYTVVMPGTFENEMRLSLRFKDGKLDHFIGNYLPTTNQENLGLLSE